MTPTRTFGRRNAPDLSRSRPETKAQPLVYADDDLPPRKSLLLDWGRYAVAALVVVVALAVIRNANEGNAATAAAPTRSSAPVKCGATLAEFYDVRAGMSYTEVRDIIGCEGELISQISLLGGNRASVSWDSERSRFGSMTASFHNGTLVSRSQFNLK